MSRHFFDGFTKKKIFQMGNAIQTSWVAMESSLGSALSVTKFLDTATLICNFLFISSRHSLHIDIKFKSFFSYNFLVSFSTSFRFFVCLI